MSRFTGGDLVEVTIQSNTAGLIRLEPKGSEDVPIDLGGYMNQDDDTNITAALSDISIKNAKKWSVTVPACGFAEEPNTLESLQGTIDRSEALVCTFTFIDNSVYRGTGEIKGALTGNKQTATIDSFKLAGGGRLEKIA